MLFETISKKYNIQHIQKIVCFPKNLEVNYSQQSINKNTQKPYLPLREAIFPLLLLSPFDFYEFALGCVEPLGLISLIT
jgi:hypothetical protein